MKNVIVGAALGILLGLLVGLSASEVLATVLGLRSEDAGGLLPGGNGARIGGFAVGMAIALMVGVVIRTHGMLEPSPSERAAAWVEAGLSEMDAVQLVAFERTGLIPAGRTVGKAAGSVASTGALFSAESLALCDTLMSRNYGSAAILDSALRAETDEWAAVADSVPKSLGDAARKQALLTAMEAKCKNG